jgi:ketosteroid isomerase-like protein
MTPEEKRAAAIRMVKSVGHGTGFADDLVTSDFVYWAHGIGSIDGETFRKLVLTMKPVIPAGPKFHITGTTLEGDRVAVEADGDCVLADGRPYKNTYHFLVVFRGDKVCGFKEYYDSKYANDTVGAIIKTLPRGPGG